jgi:hypothetical protein
MSRRGFDSQAHAALDLGPRARRGRTIRPLDLRSRAEGSIDDANNPCVRVDAPGGADSDHRSNPRAAPVLWTGRHSGAIEPLRSQRREAPWGPTSATPRMNFRDGNAIVRLRNRNVQFTSLKPRGAWTREKEADLARGRPQCEAGRLGGQTPLTPETDAGGTSISRRNRNQGGGRLGFVTLQFPIDSPCEYCSRRASS